MEVAAAFGFEVTSVALISPTEASTRKNRESEGPPTKSNTCATVLIVKAAGYPIKTWPSPTVNLGMATKEDTPEETLVVATVVADVEVVVVVAVVSVAVVMVGVSVSVDKIAVLEEKLPDVVLPVNIAELEVVERDDAVVPVGSSVELIDVNVEGLTDVETDRSVDVVEDCPGVVAEVEPEVVLATMAAVELD
jgi:hypothetical protein